MHNLGTINGATGLIYLTGTLNNSNDTLALNDSTQVISNAVRSAEGR